MKVVLNGDGGDELLGGYPRYYLSATTLRFADQLQQLHSPQQQVHWGANLHQAKSFAERLKRKWLLRMANPELQSVFMYSEFWNDPERSALTGTSSTLLADWRAHWLAQAKKSAANPIDKMLYIDNRTYLPGDLLVKMDIASMHCGLEARSPLLDHEVIEFCASLPVDLKVNNKVGKYLLKKLAERYFPTEFVHRKKMGFGIPLEKWLSGPLQALVREVLGDRDTMAPLNQTVISQVVAEFYAGNKEHSSRIWSLVMFGLWKRNCFSRSQP
jgi:asparagine synthase (glutamine-hydrolysing)